MTFEIPPKARKLLEERGQLDLGVETPEGDDDRDNMGHALAEEGRGSDGTDPGTPGVRLHGTAVPPSTPSSASAGLSDPDASTLGKFHREGHATERESAIDVYPRTGTQRRAVLDFIAAAGDRGATDRDLQQQLRIRRARTRRQELVEGGWVIDSGRTRLIDTGNHAKVWILSVAAKGRV